ncbi:DUF485 domain-containing protein [Streptomyces caeruleatus]|uniref:DUF485 domain-containing protein n=1 Tax=Streptomyces caeruleatus TaxID=661399 RepID=A0A101U7Q9_9ACTN|nr:DUF485 domain-containing protein [Streptomyces caeruleatus]KUO05580.1 hypothetical protein AQJ67_05390 [Streptomyces caeruleatus]
MYPYEPPDRDDSSAANESTDAHESVPPRIHPYEPPGGYRRAVGQLPSASLRTESALSALRAARRPPVKVAAAVVGGQLGAVVLAAEVPAVMGFRLAGPVNFGLVFMLVQLGLAAWAMVWYEFYARSKFDPPAARHRPALPHWREDHR